MEFCKIQRLSLVRTSYTTPLQDINDTDCPSLLTTALFSMNSFSCLGLTQSYKVPMITAIEAGRRQPHRVLLYSEIPQAKLHRTSLATTQSRPAEESLLSLHGFCTASFGDAFHRSDHEPPNVTDSSASSQGASGKGTLWGIHFQSVARRYRTNDWIT